jgi:hypothetical protein
LAAAPATAHIAAVHAEVITSVAPVAVVVVAENGAAADADHKTGNCCHRSDAPLPESVKEMILRCLSHLSWRSTSVLHRCFSLRIAAFRVHSQSSWLCRQPRQLHEEQVGPVR